MVIAKDISDALKKLNLTNKSICVHSSLKSFGCVKGGAKTISQVFLNNGCTLVVPTFSDAFFINPPIEKRREQNGCGDYSWLDDTLDERSVNIYTTNSNEIDMDMGAIPHNILKNNLRIRGNHPLNSFSAIGPFAERIISGQRPNDVYAPLKTLCEIEGYVVLMGVNLDRLTSLHLAEQISGRNLFRRWAKNLNGDIIEVEVGGCSEGFNKFKPVVESSMKEIYVGESKWKVFKAQTLLEIAVKAIQDNSSITHCGNVKCDRCNDALKGGPIIE